MDKLFLRYRTLWITLLILGSTLLYSFVSLQKHAQFQTFGWDTAVFDQQIHLASNFKSPYTSLMKMHGLGDHFQLVTLILGTISYWIYDSAKSLFVLQAFAGCLSALPLYLIARHLLKRSKLSEVHIELFSLLSASLYLFSVPFQSMLLDEFHNEPLILAPLIFTIYFLLKRNWSGYWISFVLVILNKEMLGLIGLPLALYTYIQTKNIKHSIATMVVGIGTSLALIFIIMPQLSGTGRYMHFNSTNRPTELIKRFANDPTRIVTDLLNTGEKRQTIAASLTSFGFLPLLSPVELIMPAYSLAIRFYDNTTPRLHAFNNHYAAPFFPLLAISFVFALGRLIRSRERYWWVIMIYLVATVLYQNYYYHGPINSIFKPSFYYMSEWQSDAHVLIGQVPSDAVIATHNSLLPHLSARNNFYLLPEVGDAQYIAVDLTDGPNKFSPLDLASTTTLVKELIDRGEYKLIWQLNQSMLLERIPR